MTTTELLAARAKQGGLWKFVPETLVSWDQKYFDLIKTKDQNSWMYFLSDILMYRWQGVLCILLLLVYLFKSIRNKNDSWKTTATYVFHFAIILTLCNFLCDELKQLFGRLKPHVDLDIPGKKQPLSFPSNHSANTAAMLGYWLWMLRYSKVKTKYIGITLLTLLWLYTAWSRIYLGEHFPLDVMGGFLFGALYGFYAAWILAKAFQSMGLWPQK